MRLCQILWKEEKDCRGSAFRLRPFVRTGKKVGETEAFLYSKNELLHTFESVCSEISSALSNCTREGTQRGLPGRPSDLSTAALGHTPYLLTVQSEPDFSELFHKPFKGYYILFL